MNRFVLITLLALSNCVSPPRSVERSPAGAVGIMGEAEISAIYMLVQYVDLQSRKTSRTDRRFVRTFFRSRAISPWTPWKLGTVKAEIAEDYARAVFTTERPRVLAPDQTRVLWGRDDQGLTCAVGLTNDDRSEGHLPGVRTARLFSDVGKDSLAGLTLLFAHRAAGARVYSPAPQSDRPIVRTNIDAASTYAVEISHRLPGAVAVHQITNGVAWDAAQYGPSWYTETTRFVFDQRRLKSIELIVANEATRAGGVTRAAYTRCVLD